MAFNGYLIRLNSTGPNDGTLLPLKYMAVESYQITPNQRMDLDTTRDTTGVLHRTALAHTASKIEFNTPYMRNNDIEAMMALYRNAWSNTRERKVKLYYYDPETNGYKTGNFYMPDIQFTMYNVDTVNNIIMYEPIRIAFIEY